MARCFSLPCERARRENPRILGKGDAVADPAHGPGSADAGLRRVATIAATASLLALTLGANTCPQSPTTAEAPSDELSCPVQEVKTIEDLANCLNDAFEEGEEVTIADTLQCIPAGCSVTLTMSRSSAQAGCFMGGAGDPNPPSGVTTAETAGPEPRCQLPRILLDCPGPPPFMPSYSLCPVGSVGEAQGSNRIEVGQVVDAAGNMRMGDIPVPPGPYEPLDPADVVSKVDGGQGTKECNQCHGNPVQNPVMGDDELSDKLPAAPECVICTDAPGQTAAPGDCQPKTTPPTPRPVEAQCLSEICDCIDQALAVEGDAHPLDDAQGVVLQKLCRALEAYQERIGVCGSEACPPQSGPACEDPGEPCNPIDGTTAAQSTGYSCQPTEQDEFQCISDQVCEAYSLTGGGKFLVGAAVSLVRLEVSGSAATTDPDALVDGTDVTATLDAYNYQTRTQVGQLSLTSFELTRAGSDFEASGTGTALVNGVPTPVHFTASQTGSDVAFELFDANDALLVGTDGEAGRAAYQLTVTP